MEGAASENQSHNDSYSPSWDKYPSGERTLGTDAGITRENAGGQDDETALLVEAVRIAAKNEEGIGSFFARNFKDQVCYDASTKKWFIFGENEHTWKEDIAGNYFHLLDGLETLFEEQAKVLAYNLKREEKGDKLSGNNSYAGPYTDALSKAGFSSPNAALKTLKEKAEQLTGYYYRKTCFEYAKQGTGRGGGLTITEDIWNRDPYLLGCRNGVVDLRSGELRTGTPEDFISFQAPVNYNPGAECPHFEEFLRDILGNDDEVYCFMQRLLGLALIGDGNIKQYIVILNGYGRNGKGTLMQTLHHVLGSQYAGKIDPSLITKNKYDTKAAGIEVFDLKNRRIVYTEETDEGDKFNQALVKMLSGGGSLKARPLYGAYTDFKSSHMVILETNNLPEFKPDMALVHRLIRFDFPFSYVENPRPSRPYEKKIDPHLPEKLREESEGILAWLIRGCREYQLAGLNIPSKIQALVEDYERENNNVSYYLENYCKTGEELKVTQANLYQNYYQNMVGEGEIVLGRNTFLKEVDSLGRELGFHRSRRLYRGLDIK